MFFLNEYMYPGYACMCIAVIHRAVRGLLAPLGGAAVYTYDRTVTIVPMVSPIMYWMFLVLARSNTSTHGYDLG